MSRQQQSKRDKWGHNTSSPSLRFSPLLPELDCGGLLCWDTNVLYQKVSHMAEVVAQQVTREMHLQIESLKDGCSEQAASAAASQQRRNTKT